SRSPDVNKNNHALFALSEIQKSEYGLLEVQFIVGQNLAKSWGSNSGNTGDGGKIVGGAIGACGRGIGNSLLVALYACMTFIYGSSWKGEIASEAKRYLDKSSQGSREVFPGEAGE
ncbi:hypothetical protein Tco_1027139, partial [Tanacetum coccineum]